MHGMKDITIPRSQAAVAILQFSGSGKQVSISKHTMQIWGSSIKGLPATNGDVLVHQVAGKPCRRVDEANELLRNFLRAFGGANLIVSAVFCYDVMLT